MEFHCRAIEMSFEEVLVDLVIGNFSTHSAAKTEMVIGQLDVDVQTGRSVSILICECQSSIAFAMLFDSRVCFGFPIELFNGDGIDQEIKFKIIGSDNQTPSSAPLK